MFWIELMITAAHESDERDQGLIRLCMNFSIPEMSTERVLLRRDAVV